MGELREKRGLLVVFVVGVVRWQIKGYTAESSRRTDLYRYREQLKSDKYLRTHGLPPWVRGGRIESANRHFV